MKDSLKWVVYGAVFAVPFVLLIVSSSMFFPFITGKNFAFRILVEVGFAAWFLLALIDKAYRPQLSYILYAVAGLVGVMFLANLLGEYAPKSFWSNYERMEGWVTLVHFFMYFIVLGSVMKGEKVWNAFFNTALIAAVIMSFYALGQVAGTFDISQGGAWRVDARLGNSSYLGVYMLFHMFIAAWMFVRTRSMGLRCLYGALFFLFAFILFHTGTRGAALGLVGGSVLAFAYLALMAPRGAAVKKWSLGGLLVVVLAAGGLWAARDTGSVRESELLNRFAGVTLAEGDIRFIVWRMAFEGVKERPILGWGQENFNYVFNKYYDPALYRAEPWYDRTHNIFLDWLIAGGVLGLLAYLSILAAALWYSVLSPLWTRFRKTATDGENFTVPEQALILGLLAAYMFHNLFVFDNLGSWIFYAVVLALVHSRVAREWTAMSFRSMSEDTWQKVCVPAVALATATAVYFVNVPGILAARDIISAHRSTAPSERVRHFEAALERGSFARQELVEQWAQVGAQVAAAERSEEVKKEIEAKVERALEDLKADKPGDARLHIIAGAFYRSLGDLDRALGEFEAAEALSPRKQAILEEQGVIFLSAGRPEEAAALFRRAFELDTSNAAARVRLAGALLYIDDREAAAELIDLDGLEEGSREWHVVVTDPLFFRLIYNRGNYDLAEYILEARRDLDPNDPEPRINLAALHFERGDKARAIRVLRQAIEDIPSLEEQAERIIAGIEASE